MIYTYNYIYIYMYREREIQYIQYQVRGVHGRRGELAKGARQGTPRSLK